MNISMPKNIKDTKCEGTSSSLYSCSNSLIDVSGPYVTPELNNELQCNVGNMWEKFALCLYALKLRDVSTSKVYLRLDVVDYKRSIIWK